MNHRPSFANIIFYLFIKYIVFFIVLAFLDDRFKTIVLDNSKDVDDIWINSFFYFFEVLFATFLFILIHIIPLYLILKLRKALYLLPLLFFWVIIEYFIYEAGASYVHFDKAGIINGIISILLLLVFFGKFIFSFKDNDETDPQLG